MLGTAGSKYDSNHKHWCRKLSNTVHKCVNNLIHDLLIIGFREEKEFPLREEKDLFILRFHSSHSSLLKLPGK